MKLIQTLERPINGYWDGGQKQVFNWAIERYAGGRDSKGEYCRIGSWTANYWFHVAKGKTEKLTLRNAMLHLKAGARKAGINATFEYKEGD